MNLLRALYMRGPFLIAGLGALVSGCWLIAILTGVPK